jgi:iron complex outermembrane receptor protein
MRLFVTIRMRRIWGDRGQIRKLSKQTVGSKIVSDNNFKRLSAGLLSAIWLAQTAPALAATAEAGPEPGAGLEEIVVTARKTSEPLQTTPVAVTALTGAGLEREHIIEVSDLQSTTPGLAIAHGTPGPSSTVYVSLRGEAQNSPNSASDNAVGIYLDGVYLARPIVGNAGFLDVAQIEVLRGPQGTLFGRNTTGGAISIKTNQPTDKLEGYVKGGFGNYAGKTGEAVLNIPIVGSELDARVGFGYESHSAYFADPYASEGVGKLLHSYQGKAQLKWTPDSIPGFNLLWSADYTDNVDTGTPAGLVGFNGAAAPLGLPNATLVALLTPYNMNSFLANPSNFKYSYGAPISTDSLLNKQFSQSTAIGNSITTDFELGAAHVKSITAYRSSRASNAQDLDATPVNFGAFYTLYYEHQTTEELQVSGNIGKFDVIGGGYYLDEAGNEESLSNTFGFAAPLLAGMLPPGVPNPLLAVNQNLATYEARSLAAFGQTNYHFTDTIRGTVGYRYTWDVRDLTNEGRNDVLGSDLCAVGATATPAAHAAGLDAPGFPCADPHQARFSYPAWTIGLDWEVINGTFVYIKGDRAFLAGGFNTRPVPVGIQQGFAPESNTDIEGGVKSDFLNRRLRTNLALFHGWQSNVQRVTNAIVNNATTQYETNAGKTRTYGAELEITAVPWSGMELSASGSYLHAAYVAGTFTEPQQLPNGTIVTVDRSNELVPQAPKFTLAFGATQTIPIAIGRLSLHADYAYRDKVAYTLDTASPLQPAAVQQAYATQYQLGILPSYGLLNAHVGLTLDNPNLEFILWGRNLAQKQYYTYMYNSYEGLGTSIDYKGDPRTYGATVEYRF